MKIVSNGKTLEVPSCASQDIYSLEEQVVGRWIDGKPLYRTSFLYNITTKDIKNVLNSNNIDIDITTLDALIDQSGPCFVNDGSKLSIGSEIFSIIIENGVFIFRQIYSSSTAYTYSGYITIEYTKTTDQATIELPAALTAAPAQVVYKAAPQSAAAVTLDAGIRTETEEV